MLDLISAALAGALACLGLLYWAARRQRRHIGRASGPNSRVPVCETVVPVIRKDRQC